MERPIDSRPQALTEDPTLYGKARSGPVRFTMCRGSGIRTHGGREPRSRIQDGLPGIRLVPLRPVYRRLLRRALAKSGDRVPSGAVRFRWPTHVMAPGMGPGFDLSRPAQQVRISRTRRNERSCARFGGRLGRRLQLERHGRPTEQALPPGKLVGPLSEGLVHGPLVRGRCSEMR